MSQFTFKQFHFTKKENLISGRIKANEEGRLSELNFRIEGDRKLTVLDTDYNNYQVYYECAVSNNNGTKRKIVEYGLMGRKQSINSSLIEKARKIFDDIGLGVVYPVDQENCQFKNLNKRPSIQFFIHLSKVNTLKILQVFNEFLFFLILFLRH